MKHMKKNFVTKNILIFIASIVIGYAFYWIVSMRIIDSLYYIDTELKGFFLYFCHVILFHLFFKTIFKIDIYYFEKIITSIAYFILMFLMFFDRVYIGARVLNLNPFDIINTIKETGIISLVLNILSFCPFYTLIKWLNKDMSHKTILFLFLVISIGVEFAQYITMSGILDIVDIILYVIGYFIGVKIYQFLRI